MKMTWGYDAPGLGGVDCSHQVSGTDCKLGLLLAYQLT